jgi:hypothetical protein
VENLLSLDITHNLNPKVLKIKDTSICVTDIENFLLEILSPNKNTWITYPVVPGFDFIGNSSNLKLTKNSIANLPDGIYEFKISHKPNFATYQHFYHLRVTTLRNRYEDLLIKFYSEKCDITKKEFSEKRNILLNIYMDLMAAIAMVEKNHDKKKGLELYNKVSEDIKNFSDDCKC